jgi:hypothetical protein
MMLRVAHPVGHRLASTTVEATGMRRRGPYRAIRLLRLPQFAVASIDILFWVRRA